MSTVGQTVEATGITERQFDYWVKRGYLRTVDPTPGKGGLRVLREGEVEVARRMRELVELGFTAVKAAEYARILANEGEIQLQCSSTRMELS